MRRRIAVVIAAVASVVAVPGAFSPASAHTDACVGISLGNAGTLGYLATGSPSGTVGFGVQMGAGTIGTCAGLGNLSITGTLSGWCEVTTGSGETGDGHSFTVTGSGYALVLSGEVTGTIKLYAESTSALPCQPEISNQFRAAIAVVLVHDPS